MRRPAVGGVRTGMRPHPSWLCLPLLTLACAAAHAGDPPPTRPGAKAGPAGAGATPGPVAPGVAAAPREVVLPLRVVEVLELTWLDRHDDEPAERARNQRTRAESFDDCVDASTGAGPPLPEEPLARTVMRAMCVMHSRGGCGRGLGMLRATLPALPAGPGRTALDQRLVALEQRSCRVDEGSVTDRVRRFEVQVLRPGSWFDDESIDLLAALAADPEARVVPAGPAGARSGIAVLATALAQALPLLAMIDRCPDVERLRAAAVELSVAVPACPGP